MRLTLTLLVVFLAGIGVGLLMRSGAAAGQRDDGRGFGLRIESGAAQPVARVVDGDTLVLENGLHVRLAGIDAPEMGRYVREPQPEADNARRVLAETIAGNAVRLEFAEDRVDRYGRLIAHVYVDNPAVNDARIDLSLALLRAGMARAYDPRGAETPAGTPAQGDPYLAELQAAERLAREERRGLWSRQRGDPAVEADERGRKWPYVAAVDSEVFHRADAAAALALPGDKLIGFVNRDAALQSGRRDAER